MRLPQRVSFSSLGGNSLLIFCGCCVFVHLIVYVLAITGGGNFPSNELLISVWASIIGISGRGGNWHLFLPLLCIKFQDTNSMSLPRGRFKKLNNLLRQSRLHRVPMQMPMRKAEQKKPKKTNRERKEQKKKAVKREKEDKYKFKKPVQKIRDEISAGSPYSKTSFFGDHTSIKHQVNPLKRPIIRNTQVTNSFRPSQHTTNNSLHGGYKVKIKKKKNRRGKNANEFPPPPPQQASSLFPFTLLGNAILTEDEEEALRRKILAKVDELDPLLCLPKVLCGYSSRRRHKNYNSLNTPPTTSTTLEPPRSEDIIDEYLQLLGIHPPIPEDTEIEKVKKTKKVTKATNPPAKKITKAAKKKHEKTSSLENDIQDEEESGSSSAESNEYNYYNRYPHAHPGSRPYPGKFLFNRDRESGENDDDDENASEIEGEGEDDLMDDFIDDEDVKYIMQREKMQRLQSQVGPYSDENWWSPFDKSTMPPSYNYYPVPTQPTMYPPSAADDILSSSLETGGITGWFTNMISNFMPRISWAGSTKKDDFDIKSDPFFTSFDGRSLDNGEGRTFSRNSLLGNNSHETRQKRRGRTGKQLGTVKDDPAEKYRTAVEIGTRVVSPTQCDFIYNGCPLSYVEILAIINEPERQLPTTIKTSPPVLNIFTSSSTSTTTATTTSRPTTSKTTTATRKTTKATTTSVATTPSTTTTTTATTTSKPPTTTKGKWVFVHNKLITPASPSQHNSISMHYPHRQQQQRRPPYAPPQQSIVFQPQQKHQLQPNFHNSHSQQVFHNPPHTQNPPIPLYNHQTPQQQQYQAQLAHLHQILQNSQFHAQHPQPQHQPGQFVNSPETGSQVTIPKVGNKNPKTKIRQALPSGEVEISVEYKPDPGAEYDDDVEAEPEPNLPPQNILGSHNFAWPQSGNPVHMPQYLPHPYSASSSMSGSYEYNPRIEPFKRKVLTNYEFFPTNGYKIRRKNGELDKASTVKRKGIMLGSSEEISGESEESNVSTAPPPKTVLNPKRKLRRNEFKLVNSKKRNKVAEKHKRKQSHKTALPTRGSSFYHQYNDIQPHKHFNKPVHTSKWKRKKAQTSKTVNMTRKKYAKKENKRIEKDGNSSENSSENNSSSPSTEQLEHNKEKLNAPARYFSKKNKTRRKALNKKKRKPHLHKQSSESIEVEKRPKIAGPNAIDPIYGHPFPTPYAGYYHRPSPSTTTSSSFFSYFFGR